MDEWQRAVVRIWQGKPTESDASYFGTGFLVAPTLLLTAYHVVEDIPLENIYLQGPLWAGVRRPKNVTKHSTRDIATIEISESDVSTPYIRIDRNIPITGESVKFVGYTTPEKDQDQRLTYISGYDGEHNSYVLQGYIGTGMSGGPVLRINNDKCIGIIHARDIHRNCTYFIPASAFHDFIPTTTDPIEESRTSRKLLFIIIVFLLLFIVGFFQAISEYDKNILVDVHNKILIHPSNSEGIKLGYYCKDMETSTADSSRWYDVDTESFINATGDINWRSFYAAYRDDPMKMKGIILTTDKNNNFIKHILPHRDLFTAVVGGFAGTDIYFTSPSKAKKLLPPFKLTQSSIFLSKTKILKIILYISGYGFGYAIGSYGTTDCDSERHTNIITSPETWKNHKNYLIYTLIYQIEGYHKSLLRSLDVEFPDWRKYFQDSAAPETTQLLSACQEAVYFQALKSKSKFSSHDVIYLSKLNEKYKALRCPLSWSDNEDPGNSESCVSVILLAHRLRKSFNPDRIYEICDSLSDNV